MPSFNDGSLITIARDGEPPVTVAWDVFVSDNRDDDELMDRLAEIGEALTSGQSIAIAGGASVETVISMAG